MQSSLVHSVFSEKLASRRLRALGGSVRCQTGPASTGGEQPKPAAHVSVDLDPIDTHLAGYGLKAAPCDLIYRLSIPRILDLLDMVRLKATFFFVARDAKREAFTLKEIVARGHEIASHSFSHTLPFSLLPAHTLQVELLHSRQQLEAASGCAVVGFRAPGWEVSRPLLRAVALAGYRYDASVFPSLGLIGARVLRLLASGGKHRNILVQSAFQLAFARPYPHKLAWTGGDLWEFPVAVSPLLRVPFLHTTWYLLPHTICWRIYRACRKTGYALSYQFHAADLLDMEHDKVDPRMSRHPGMRMPLEHKRELLAAVLRRIAADYSVSTYAETVNGR